MFFIKIKNILIQIVNTEEEKEKKKKKRRRRKEYEKIIDLN
jgi:hypothetical protein